MKNLSLSKLKNMIFKPSNLGLHCHCAENKEKFLELLQRAKAELEEYKKIKLIPSIEMPGSFNFTNLDGENYNIETHILGYGVDISKEEMLKKFVSEKYKSLNQEEEL